MKATRNCCWLLLAGLVSCLLLPKAATDSVQTFAPAETTWKKFEEKLLTLPMEKHRFQRRLMETARIDRRRDIARKGRVPSDQKHEIVIALKQRNIDLLEKKLREVSDPNSLLYGQHLTTQEVNQLTGNPEAVAFVKSFLQRQGISVIKVSRNNAFITAEASVGQWEELLETQFHYFEQEDQEGQLFVRTLSYSLPENLAEHVHTLFRVAHMPNKVRGIPHYSVINNQSNSTDFRSYGRNHSPTLRRSSGSVNTLTSSLNTVTPSLVKSYHEIDSTVGNSLASQAVYETIGQTYSPADLAAFQRHFKLSVEPVAHVINGHSSDNVCASNGGSDCIEANLDVQYLM